MAQLLKGNLTTKDETPEVNRTWLFEEYRPGLLGAQSGREDGV